MEFHHARHVSAFERPHRQNNNVQYKQVSGQSGEVSSFDSGYQRSHESAPYNSLEQLMSNERLTPASSYHLTRADSAPRSIYSYTIMPRTDRWSPGQPTHTRHHYSFGPDMTPHGYPVAALPTHEYQWQLHRVDPMHGQPIGPPPGTQYVRIDPERQHNYNVVPTSMQPTYYQGGASSIQQAPPTTNPPTTDDPDSPYSLVQRVMFVTPDEEEEDMGVVTDHGRNIFESMLGPEQFQQFCVPVTQTISPQPSPRTLERRVADIATKAGFIPVQPSLNPSPMSPTISPQARMASSDDSSTASSSSSSLFAISSAAPSVTPASSSSSSSACSQSFFSPALSSSSSSAFTPIVTPPGFAPRTTYTIPPFSSASSSSTLTSSSSMMIQSSFVSPPLSEAASQQLSIAQIISPPLASSAESVPSAFMAPPRIRTGEAAPTNNFSRLLPTTSTINSAFMPIMAMSTNNKPPAFVAMPKLQAALHASSSMTRYESEDDDVIFISASSPAPRHIAGKKRAAAAPLHHETATTQMLPLRNKLPKVKKEDTVASATPLTAPTHADTNDDSDDDVIFVSVTYPNRPAASRQQQQQPPTRVADVAMTSQPPATGSIRTKLKRSPSGNGMVIVHPSPVPSKKKKPNHHQPTHVHQRKQCPVVHQRKQCPVKQSASAPVVPSVGAVAVKQQQATLHKSKSHVSTEEIAFFPNTDFHSKYTVLNEIGKGGGGTVYAGKRKSDGLEVAIKKIDMKTVKRWSQIKGQTVPIEFALYKKAASNNKAVVQPLDWFENKKKYLLVMERTRNVMDLFDLMNCKGPLPEKSAKIIFKQVVNAVRVCHKNGVVHRDIKDENVLVNPETFEAKLIDFGCAARLKEADYLEFAGTPEFYPPEWFKSRRYNGRLLDTWSLGVLLYTMIESEVPFKERADICKCNLQFKRSTRSSSLCRKFIREMLDADEKKRIRLEDIMSHPWMTAKE